MIWGLLAVSHKDENDAIVFSEFQNIDHVFCVKNTNEILLDGLKKNHFESFLSLVDGYVVYQNNISTEDDFLLFNKFVQEGKPVLYIVQKMPEFKMAKKINDLLQEAKIHFRCVVKNNYDWLLAILEQQEITNPHLIKIQIESQEATNPSDIWNPYLSLIQHFFTPQAPVQIEHNSGLFHFHMSLKQSHIYFSLDSINNSPQTSLIFYISNKDTCLKLEIKNSIATIFMQKNGIQKPNHSFEINRSFSIQNVLHQFSHTEHKKENFGAHFIHTAMLQEQILSHF